MFLEIDVKISRPENIELKTLVPSDKKTLRTSFEI